MIEGVRGTSIYNRSCKGGSICLESSAESREYMLTYFWGMGTYFYWGMEAYIYWGDGSKSLGDEYPHPSWICTPDYRPLIKRIKKHESHSRLHLHNPDDYSHDKSVPAPTHWTQDSLGQNYNTHNYMIQDTIGPHRTQPLKRETLHLTVQTVPLH